MCSIIAVSGNWEEEILKQIMKNSRIRGLHSFGYSFVEKNKIKNSKFIDYDQFIESLIQKKPNKFIAHFRYSTSGDWKVIENNQPIFLDDFCLAFNGVIDMSSKSEMEKKFNVEMKTENDGEIAILKYKEGKDSFLNFINQNKRTFAGVFLNNKNEITAIKNNLRPLSISKYNNATYIASTSDILLRSGLNNNEKLKSNTYYEI